MIPQTANLTIYQGSTWTQAVAWRSGATRAVVDISGYSARMQLRTSVTAASAAIELTTANGRITLGGVNGRITLSLSASESAALASGEYVYDLELFVGTVVTRVLQGTATVVAEVTR